MMKGWLKITTDQIFMMLNLQRRTQYRSVHFFRYTENACNCCADDKIFFNKYEDSKHLTVTIPKNVMYKN